MKFSERILIRLRSRSLGRGAAPVAAFLALRQHFEVVHQRAHPGLHLFFFGAGQEADVLAQRHRDARHDDLAEAALVERLGQPRGQREQVLPVPAGPRMVTKSTLSDISRLSAKFCSRLRAVMPQTLLRPR
jgi:hypothetical protein